METTTIALTAEQAAVGGAAIGGILGLGLGVILTALIVLWVFQIIAFWKIFTKAGEPGWKSIIPVYSGYVQYKITWKPMWFWVMFAATIVYSMASQFMTNGSTSMILSAIVFIASIVMLVIQIISYVKLSRSFGHGIGFALGLIFLYPIFVLILGYGSSEYKGADL